MTLEYLETYKELISSNQKLMSTLQFKELDINIEFELVLLYLKLNKDLFIKIISDEVLTDIVLNDNYYINGNQICNSGNCYSISYLRIIVDKINDRLNKDNHEKVIDFDYVKTEPPKRTNKNIHNEDNNVYELPILSKDEKRYILERTQRLSEETTSYVTDVEYDFTCDMSYIIYCILNKVDPKCTEQAIQFLIGIINLYPYLIYNDDNLYPDFKIRQNDICVIKATYEDCFINFKEKKIDECEHKKQILRLRKEYIEKWCYYKAEEKIKKIDNEIEKLDHRELSLGIDLYETKHIEANFNYQLFNTIKKAFDQLHIDLRITCPIPTVTLFSIKDNQLENMVEMHLSTFLRLIDNDKLLSEINNHLLKKVDNK